MDTTIRHLRDLTPDTRNANLGTPRGQHLIEESLRQYGAGRSILIDKNGVIMAISATLLLPVGKQLQARSAELE